MYKISEQAANAFFSGKEFKQSNTEVFKYGKYIVCTLWGNWIAARKLGSKKVLYDHCGWHTATTRERLNALGANVRIKQGAIVKADGSPFKPDAVRDIPYEF